MKAEDFFPFEQKKSAKNFKFFFLSSHQIFKGAFNRFKSFFLFKKTDQKIEKL